MAEEIMITVEMIGEGLTLEEVQSVFFNWMERLEWIIEHGRESYI
jgi:hypothetical protein